MNASTIFLIILILAAIGTIISHFRSIRKEKDPVPSSGKGEEKPVYPCKKYVFRKESVEKMGYLVYENCKGQSIGVMIDSDRTICVRRIISTGDITIEEIEAFC